MLQPLLQCSRGAPALLGVVPLAPGVEAGMDASGTAVAAALLALHGGSAVGQAATAALDLVRGDVRLPRLEWPTPAAALAALDALTRGARVSRKADSAAMSVEAAARAPGAQGAEAHRLQAARLDEAFEFITSRADHPPHAAHALLLNTRLDAAAVAAAAGAGGGGAAAAPLPPALAPLSDATDWAQWEQHGGYEECALEDEVEGGGGGEAAVLARRERLLAALRRTLGVQRLPLLAELEGYRCAATPPCPSLSPASDRSRRLLTRPVSRRPPSPSLPPG